MREVAAGNESAFNALCRQFHGLVYTTVYRVINNPRDAEDITQEVLLAIWKKSTTWEADKGKLSTWIASIARNRAIDTIRSKQRRAILCEKVQTEESARDLVTLEYSANEEMQRSEAHAIARRANVELSPEQREAIELVYFRGLTQAEAAKRAGIPIGTAKARIRRGAQRLRDTVPQLIRS